MPNNISIVWNRLLAIAAVLAAGMILVLSIVKLSPSARAQTLIPDGSDAALYINGNSGGVPHWTSTNNAFAISADTTWVDDVTFSHGTPSQLSFEGNGHTVNRTVNLPMFNITTAFDGTNISLSNTTIKYQPSTGNDAVFRFASTTNGTTAINLSNVTFDGMRGGYAGIFEIMSTNNMAVVVNAGTGDNGARFINGSTFGNGGGVMSIYSGSMTFNGDYTFNNNSTDNYGGAIAMYEAPGNITFNGKTTFTGNFARIAFGGAIDIWGGASNLIFNAPATFTGNHVVADSVGTNNPRGGAINIGYTSPGSGASVVRFNDTVSFDGNYIVSTGRNGSAYGGALSAYGNGASYNYQYIFNGLALFQNNYAAKAGAGSGGGYGGAIYYDSSAALLQFLSGTRFLNNYASTYGGAIYLQSGRIVLDAESGDIEFQGNKQGVQFDANYKPIAGTGTPNAIMLGTSGTLELDAASGRTIRFRDPIASLSSSKSRLVKTGAGEVIFYGDNGSSTLYDSSIAIDTSVQGGYFTLADGVQYGSTTSGDFIITSGANGTTGTLRGGANTRLHSHSVTVEDKGAIGVAGGSFTVDAASITFEGGSRLSGFGTLAATSPIRLNGTVAAIADVGTTLQISPNVTGTGGLDVQTGTLALAGSSNSFTGTTHVSSGATLLGKATNAFAQSSAVTVDGTLDMSGNYSQTANNFSGSGAVILGTQGNTALTAANSTDAAFSGLMSGQGNLVKTGAGTLTMSGRNTYTGGTTITAGKMVGTNGSAFGTGAIANATALQLDFAADGVMENALSGTGSLTKTGAGTATLLEGGTQGAIAVNAGELRFGQTGVMNADTYVTASGASTTVQGHAQLAVADTFTQSANSTLRVGFASNIPVISAKSATIDGALFVTGFTSPAPDTASQLTSTIFTVLQTTDGITGDFSSVDLGSEGSALDYLIVAGQKSADNLSYGIGLSLTWLGGETLGNGIFTTHGPAERFNADVVLADQAASATGWDGKSLTKNGPGTLVLSAANTYTGTTVVNGGTLAMGIEDALATSSSLTLNTNSTLALNDFSQTVNLLSGAGSIQTGTASGTRLTTVNATDTTFSGDIHGAGGITKTGAGTLTLSGISDYTGGTTVDAGTLVGTVGQAFGTGIVTNNAAVQLDFAGDGTVANALAGSGSLTKTGAGTATLSSAGTQGAISVDAGALAFNQSGVFQADSVTTKTGAATLVTGDARLNVTNGFDMGANSTLGVVLGSNQPVVSADAATIDGALYIVGFAPSGPNTASALIGTRFTLLETTGGITGEFTTKDFGGAAAGVDYLLLDARKSSDNLSYIAGLGLAWRSGAETGTGTFTLNNASDLFNVDVVLADQAASSTGWDGTTLTKNGAGTLMLSAANTYTGATLLNGGTLSMGIANAFATSRQVTMAESSTLALNDFSQTANELSGAGNITLGTSGSTVLTVNNADDRTFSGTISGAGGLTKVGGGTLLLSGNNTYAGGTTISGGTLRGSIASLGTGDILNDSALVVDQPGNVTFAAAINGTGSFTKTGAGELNLTGTSGLSGATTVESGTLRMNGSMANSAITMLSGTTLAGNGVIGRTSLMNGATISPGNSIGTMQVKGDYSQASGAKYEVEVNLDNETSDMVQVDGTASIEPGAVLNVKASNSGTLSRNTRFTVLTTTQGLTGTFTLTGDLISGYYKLVDSYDALNAYLTTIRFREFPDAARTPNEIATAAGAVSLPDDNPIKTKLNGFENDDDVRLGLNQLSGEIHASLKTGLLNDSHQVRDTAIARIRQANCAPDVDLGIQDGAERPPAGTNDVCTPGRWQPVGWVRVFGAWGNADSDGNAAKMKQNTGGLLIGTDATVYDEWRVGALAGYNHSSFKASDRNSSASSDSYHLGVYGGKQWDRIGVRMGSSITMHEIDTDRSPTFSGFSEHNKGGYNARSIQAFGDFGYQLSFAQGKLEPFVNIAYVNLHNDAFSESGGTSALSGNSESSGTTFTTLGVRGARDITMRNIEATVRGTIGWQYAFGTVAPESTMAFQGGVPFVIAAVPVARNAGILEVGLDARIKRNTTLGVSLSGQFGGGANNQTIQGTLRSRF